MTAQERSGRRFYGVVSYLLNIILALYLLVTYSLA